eukprot:647044-Prymnesium_polylepis.1
MSTSEVQRRAREFCNPHLQPRSHQPEVAARCCPRAARRGWLTWAERAARLRGARGVRVTWPPREPLSRAAHAHATCAP